MSGDTRGFVQVWQLKDIVPGRVALDAIDVRRPPLRARRSWRAGETCCTRVSVPYTTRRVDMRRYTHQLPRAR